MSTAFDPASFQHDSFQIVGGIHPWWFYLAAMMAALNSRATP
jgi:hypothetical protein